MNSPSPEVGRLVTDHDAFDSPTETGEVSLSLLYEGEASYWADNTPGAHSAMIYTSTLIMEHSPLV